MMRAREGEKEVEDLRGVQVGMLIKVKDLAAYLRASVETIAMWRKAGLPVITLGTKSDLILTEDLFEWIRSKPQIGVRPSAIRQKRLRDRKRRRAEGGAK